MTAAPVSRVSPSRDGDPALVRGRGRDARIASASRSRGEIARGDPLPPGPYAVSMMHGPGGIREWPFTVVCGDGRAIAGHVPSRECAQAIVDALNHNTRKDGR